MQHIGKMVGKYFKSSMNNAIYEVRLYLAAKDWYKCRYYVSEENKYYYCYLTEAELMDKSYFTEVVTKVDVRLPKGKMNIDIETNGQITKYIDPSAENTILGDAMDEMITDFDNLEESCHCGIDKIGGGKHSDWCPKQYGE